MRKISSIIMTQYIQQTPLFAFRIFSACTVSALNANDAKVISFSTLFSNPTCAFDSSFSPFDCHYQSIVAVKYQYINDVMDHMQYNDNQYDGCKLLS